ncbi:MAG: hypothetical protein OEV30_08930 [Ignavibacteria bacterium]|nr:hypothetical protein [Ignavibacteria bacterium]
MSNLLRAFSALLVAGGIFISGCTKDETTGPDQPGPVTEQDGFLYLVSGQAGQAGGGGNGGPATAAFHYWPQDGAFNETTGDNYIMDWNNHCIRIIKPDGTIDRFVGSGFLGDDATGNAADIDLNHPVGVTIGPDGNLYMGAWHNWKIKKIDLATMMVTSPVGTSQGNDGDGGPATAAKLDLPGDLVYDNAGNMYISDQGNSRIRKVDPSGIITNFVGSPTREKGFVDGVGDAARFSFPRGSDAVPGGKLAIDEAKAFIYVADTENNAIRKINIATREVTTIAGNGTAGYTGDGGPASAATLNFPTDVEMTHEGLIYLSDSRNHVVRLIDVDGTIRTVVGTGTAGASDGGIMAEEAQLRNPGGLWWKESTHTLYIADTFNHRVMKVTHPH